MPGPFGTCTLYRAEAGCRLTIPKQHCGSQDLAVAMSWYSIGAGIDVDEAQYRLALMSANGKRVKRNLVKAYAWMTIAMNNENENARKWRGEIAEHMTQKQIEKATQFAARLRESIEFS